MTVIYNRLLFYFNLYNLIKTHVDKFLKFHNKILNKHKQVKQYVSDYLYFIIKFTKSLNYKNYMKIDEWKAIISNLNNNKLLQVEKCQLNSN